MSSLNSLIEFSHEQFHIPQPYKTPPKISIHTLHRPPIETLSAHTLHSAPESSTLTQSAPNLLLIISPQIPQHTNTPLPHHPKLHSIPSILPFLLTYPPPHNPTQPTKPPPNLSHTLHLIQKVSTGPSNTFSISLYRYPSTPSQTNYYTWKCDIVP